MTIHGHLHCLKPSCLAPRTCPRKGGVESDMWWCHSSHQQKYILLSERSKIVWFLKKVMQPRLAEAWQVSQKLQFREATVVNETCVQAQQTSAKAVFSIRSQNTPTKGRRLRYKKKQTLDRKADYFQKFYMLFTLGSKARCCRISPGNDHWIQGQIVPAIFTIPFWRNRARLPRRFLKAQLFQSLRHNPHWF